MRLSSIMKSTILISYHLLHIQPKILHSLIVFQSLIFLLQHLAYFLIPLLPTNNTNLTPPIICQYCNKHGHDAKRCSQFFPQRPSVNLATTSQFAQHPWIVDSDASHHVTSQISNFSSHQPYEGPNDIQIGDGSGLQITHTGSVSLSPFNLSNVLCVTSIKQTLISVSKFCKSNQTSIEFFPTYFVLQHLCTGKPLLSGKNWYDLYEWPTTKGVHTSLAMTFSTNVTAISGNLA